MKTQALDRGLLYGDGFFTTVLVQSGQLANWSAHWQRLQSSAERLKFPALSERALLDQIAENFQLPTLEQEVLKILVTRGVGGIGYQPLLEPKPVIYLQRLAFPAQQPKNTQAWSVFELKMTLSDVACAQQPLLAGLKHCNRLENVLARQALIETEFDEALMLGQQGEVISATQANIILIQGKTLVTPALTKSGVAGTCLNSLPQALAEKMPEQSWQWQTRSVSLQDIEQADELFCCNAIRGVMPVTQFQNQRFPVEKSHQIAQAWLKWQAEHLFTC